MLYREVGQYKTSYAADMAIFPILQDRIAVAIILLIAFVLIPLLGNDFLLNSVLIPFLIFSLAAIGLNLLTGYAGLLSLGTGAFMGVGAYACLKLTTSFPLVNIVIWILFCGRRHAVWLAVTAHQGFLSRGGNAGGAILSGMVFHSYPLALQQQCLGSDRSSAAKTHGRTDYRPNRHLADALSGRFEHRRSDDLDRREPGAWPHRPYVDVGSRHGSRRRTDRHQATSRQVARLRRFFVL